jgi:signal transduction histidine kinase
MSIKQKILLYFSVVTIVMVGAAFIFIYTLFYQYRIEDFHNQQKEKIINTLKFLTKIEEIDEELIDAMDRISINDVYAQKLFIFDKNKKLLYSRLDHAPTSVTESILSQLSSETTKVEEKKGRYDILGIYVEQDGEVFYGISNAYDLPGYHKLNYLKYILFLTFMVIVLVVIFMSYYLSQKITSPIVALTRQIKDFNFESKYEPIAVTDGKKNEVAVLGQRFNELMQRMNEAFSFQKNAVHHISHELKTPIAVLVSNFERIEKETDINRIKYLIKDQKEDTENLSKIINSLLEIAKTESGNNTKLSKIRIDELIFDLVDELNLLYPDFQFSIKYSDSIEDESKLTIHANLRLLKAALSNLMINCIQYSNDNLATIEIEPVGKRLQIDFINNGPVINENERQYIYGRYFRGENSKGKRGFGLGLVFIKKILTMHNGEISYTANEEAQSNKFTITLPLK